MTVSHHPIALNRTIPLIPTQPLEFEAGLLERLDQSAPRYTSYPTADRLTHEFGESAYRRAIQQRSSGGARRPLSLYVHIPFCETVCYYCACNKVVTRDRRKLAQYLSYLLQELKLQSQAFGNLHHEQIEQLHFGGGTPTYLDDTQLARLMQALRQYFPFATDHAGEYSIEIDPRSVGRERIALLRELGFNRVSLGVQDFDPAVQQAVNRIQPEAVTLQTLDSARHYGFRSVSMDLIYGLPLQTTESFERTLTRVIAASPDRIALYNYAHLPHLFKPQRRIDLTQVPSLTTRLAILHLAIQSLTAAGYVYIGMDHFAKPTDELATAQQQGRLHRNFQGYSTHAGSDLIALGVSAIGAVGGTYSQNEKELDAYYNRLDNNEIPIMRGIQLSIDDHLRRSVIHSLMCNFSLSIESVEQAYPIHFRDYFAPELTALEKLAADDLVNLDGDWITVTLKGRLLIRNIVSLFDRFLQTARRTGSIDAQRYSKAI